MRQLAESQKSMIQHCLRVAAERFDQDAKVCMATREDIEPPNPVDTVEAAGKVAEAAHQKLPKGITVDLTPTPEGLIRLARQFTDQASEARALADTLEQAESVTVTA